MVSPAPSGRWKVKLKLKFCNGSSFVDTASQKIVGQPSGRFDGVFPISEGRLLLAARDARGRQAAREPEAVPQGRLIRHFSDVYE